MGRIKVIFPDGGFAEKPLVTSFKNANGSYIILDNESIGTMGLPVICVSKINDDVVTKITDANEWAGVKESLKSIISGGNIEYLNASDIVGGTRDFYTQLTLPEASFEVLKNKYVPKVEMPKIDEFPEVPEIDFGFTPKREEPLMEKAVFEESKTYDIPRSYEEYQRPVQRQPEVQKPFEPTPVISIVNPVRQQQREEQVPQRSQRNNMDVAQMKEQFMAACENMFDALAKKFMDDNR